ncbi:nicotinate-nucleotide--dimethylbenzimidazole phosphoribosyltransferase [Streptomonospora wellingtoniae]|uniref:Nicotinate-nucleotide--dimethylbenzimidazole phosphoribosyltransferase n=1 Tax=Streptomonospora wellingtoniae TaxID=3075544 RepID=A0ABU2KPP2_9ACTN|nr:nicotinate-nucleotide--dimethylbenzimidazole phosphoribosyltransferase [Streptomonospora sp. DSM 45055]MDT0301249.1 nicotinate-nucleotide--dimethylbenzimidazole phosphoribosyltransferase [Streptomonospora sp. DSM 45055]
MTGEDRRRGAEDNPESERWKGLLDDLPETGRGSGSAPSREQESDARTAQQRPNPFHAPVERRRGGGAGGAHTPYERPNVIPFRGAGQDRDADVEADRGREDPSEREWDAAEQDSARASGSGRDAGAAHERDHASAPAAPQARHQYRSEPRETGRGQQHPPGPQRRPGADAPPAAQPAPSPAPEPARTRERAADQRAPAPMAPQYPPPSRASAPGPASRGAPAGQPERAAPRPGTPAAPDREAPAAGGAEHGPPTPNEVDSPVNAHAAASYPEHPDDLDGERAEAPAAGAQQQAPEHAAAPGRGSPDAHAYGDTERDAVYRAIRERRDVRMGFRLDPVPDAVLERILDAAHRAPSVGYSQPWDFIVVQDEDVRSRVQKLVQAQRESYARALPGARARAFSGLKVEAVLDTPVNIVVTVDPTRGGRHTLGRHSQPQTAAYSTALAVENLWLAARAEGLGVGWVSFFEERELAASLDLPPHLEVVAYLCVGYVEDFPPEPELAMGGWARGRPLHWAVHREHYGRRGLPGQAATSLLEETIAAIGPLNQRAVNDAEERQAAMTKPPGSLGVLEEVSIRLAGLAGECPPPIPEPAAVAIFAGDHGVHAQGVTSWPQEVTAQMVHNFLGDGAVVNAFAEQVGAEVTIVDVGVASDLPAVPGLLPRKVARGTADFTRGPAMSRTQADYAIEAGIEVARDLVSAGNRCLVTGDMGIANTTPSAALVSVFTGTDPAEVTGRGTGADDAALERKIEVVRRGLAANETDPEDPVGVLAAVGGLEHAALAGFILGAAAMRVPVLLDGVIAGAAALAAAKLEPLALNACFAGHRSTEPGHAAVLSHIGLRPLVDLEMRLGEGSGALLALPILQGSARALRNVATFDSAGVSERG